jgi:hypothetical protein
MNRRATDIKTEEKQAPISLDRRNEIMGSRRFASEVCDAIRDDLTDPEAGVIAHYILRKDDAACGHWMREIFSYRIQKILDDMLAEEK